MSDPRINSSLKISPKFLLFVGSSVFFSLLAVFHRFLFSWRAWRRWWRLLLGLGFCFAYVLLVFFPCAGLSHPHFGCFLLVVWCVGLCVPKFSVVRRVGFVRFIAWPVRIWFWKCMYLYLGSLPTRLTVHALSLTMTFLLICMILSLSMKLL